MPSHLSGSKRAVRVQKTPTKSLNKVISSKNLKTPFTHAPKQQQRIYKMVSSSTYQNIFNRILRIQSLSAFIKECIGYVDFDEEQAQPFIHKKTSSKRLSFSLQASIGSTLKKDGSFVKHYCVLLEKQYPSKKSQIQRMIYDTYKKDILVRVNIFEKYFKEQIQNDFERIEKPPFRSVSKNTSQSQKKLSQRSIRRINRQRIKEESGMKKQDSINSKKTKEKENREDNFQSLEKKNDYIQSYKRVDSKKKKSYSNDISIDNLERRNYSVSKASKKSQKPKSLRKIKQQNLDIRQQSHKRNKQLKILGTKGKNEVKKSEKAPYYSQASKNIRETIKDRTQFIGDELTQIQQIFQMQSSQKLGKSQSQNCQLEADGIQKNEKKQQHQSVAKQTQQMWDSSDDERHRPLKCSQRQQPSVLELITSQMKISKRRQAKPKKSISIHEWVKSISKKDRHLEEYLQKKSQELTSQQKRENEKKQKQRQLYMARVIRRSNHLRKTGIQDFYMLDEEIMSQFSPVQRQIVQHFPTIKFSCKNDAVDRIDRDSEVSLQLGTYKGFKISQVAAFDKSLQMHFAIYMEEIKKPQSVQQQVEEKTSKLQKLKKTNDSLEDLRAPKFSPKLFIIQSN